MTGLVFLGILISAIFLAVHCTVWLSTCKKVSLLTRLIEWVDKMMEQIKSRK